MRRVTLVLLSATISFGLQGCSRQPGDSDEDPSQATQPIVDLTGPFCKNASSSDYPPRKFNFHTTNGIDTVKLVTKDAGWVGMTEALYLGPSATLLEKQEAFEKYFRLELIKSGIHIQAYTVSVTSSSSSETTTDVQYTPDTKKYTFVGTKSGVRFAIVWKNKTYMNVVADGCDDGLHRHFGKMVVDSGGGTHIVYRRAPFHGLTTESKVVYRYSGDSGRTWSAEDAGIVADGAGGFDVRDATIGLTKAGKVIVAATHTYFTTGSDGIAQDTKNHFVAYSKRDGGGWDKSVIYDQFGPGARTHGKIVLLPNGDLIVTGYKKDNQYFWASSNGGGTWRSLPGGISIGGSGNSFAEFDIVAASDSKWLGIGRPYSGNAPTGPYVQFKTDDAGSSWSYMGRAWDPQAYGKRASPVLGLFDANNDGNLQLAFLHTDRERDSSFIKFANFDEAYSAQGTSATEFLPPGNELSSEPILSNWSDGRFLIGGMGNASGYGSVLYDPARRVFKVLTFQEFDGKYWVDAAKAPTQVLYFEILLDELMAMPEGWTPYATLHSVLIEGPNLVITYSKNFAACARLLNTSSQATHTGDFFCASGSNITVTQPLSSFIGISAGTPVKLRDAYYAGTPSNIVAAQNASVTLHSSIIKGSNLVITYSKNFAACARLLNTSSQATHTGDFFCASGSNITVTQPLSSFSTSAAAQVKLCHGGNNEICSDLITTSSQ